MRWSASVTRGFRRHARTRRSCEEGRERRACGRRQQHHPHRDRREGLGGRTRWRLYARLQHSRRFRPQNGRCISITDAERIKSAVPLCLRGYAPSNPAGYLNKKFAKLGAGAASISPNGGATFPLQGLGFGFQIGRQSRHGFVVQKSVHIRTNLRCSCPQLGGRTGAFWGGARHAAWPDNTGTGLPDTVKATHGQFNRK